MFGMIDYELVDIKPLSKELFDEINNIFENDSSVSKFVSFHYQALVTNGIFYGNQYRKLG